MEITEIYTGPLFVKTRIVMLDDKTAMVVDPGGADEELIEYLQEKKVERLEILITHGHFDHVGGVPELFLKYPKSSVWIHKGDGMYLGKGAKEAHIECFKAIKAERYIHALEYEFPDATHYYDEGDIVHGLKVLHTPGHTEGSVCLWNEEEKVIFTGDTLFYHNRGRTDLIGGDEETIIKSLKRLATLPEDTIVYPGHGSDTSIGEEKKWIETL